MVMLNIIIELIFYFLFLVLQFHVRLKRSCWRRFVKKNISSDFENGLFLKNYAAPSILWNFCLSISHTICKFRYFCLTPMEFHMISTCQLYAMEFSPILFYHSLWKFHYSLRPPWNFRIMKFDNPWKFHYPRQGGGWGPIFLSAWN